MVFSPDQITSLTASYNGTTVHGRRTALTSLLVTTNDDEWLLSMARSGEIRGGSAIYLARTADPQGDHDGDRHAAEGQQGPRVGSS